MGIGVLGPLRVEGNTATINRRDRVVLEALVACRGDVLSRDALADAVWGEHPPASADKNLQGCVMRLRRIVGAAAIETLPHGYRFAAPPDLVDATRFERLVGRGRDLLALGDPDRSGYLLGQALALWRGEALADLREWEAGRIEAERLTELRLDAEELRLDAALRRGEHARVLTDLRALVRAHPLRERRWSLLALAQYRAGRQAEALRTLRQVRTVLGVELGLDPGPELTALERSILAHDPALTGLTALPAPSEVCPYRGLLAYQVDDADAFFGRAHDVTACLDRLRETGAVTVVGASGCGKSSLVRAGIAAALGREGRKVWVLTPGPRPLEALAGAGELGAGTVLVVDQCEEVFVQAPESDRAAFLDLLVAHAERDPLVVSLRADALGDLSVHPAFARLAERGLYLLGAMPEAGLRAAIEGPARQAGLTLEPGLVDLLVRECEGEAGALPLLSHALRECWERREGRTLTVAGYTATGGIRGAVARSAEVVYAQVSPQDRPLVRDLMLRLVMPGPEGASVRSRLPRRLVVVDPVHDRLVELLIAARLVTSDDEVVELAHEALVRAWPRLRGWLDDDTEGHRILRHLAGAADAWRTMGRPDSELYRGARLATALDWSDRAGPGLTGTEREFLATAERLERESRRAAERRALQERRVGRRLRVLLAGVLTLLLVAVLASLGALRQAHRADTATRVSDSRLAGARGLLAEEPDRAVLLAIAGVQLDDSPATRANLLATLARQPQLIGAASGRGGQFWGMEGSPDGSTLAVYDDHSDIWLYDARTRRVRARFDTDGGKQQIAFWPGMSPIDFSPDGALLAVGKVNLDQESIVLLDTRHFEPVRTPVGGLPSSPSLVSDVRFSPDGTRLAAAFIHHRRGSDAWVGSSVLVWDTADLAHPVDRIRLDGPAGLTTVAFGRDRDLLWVYRDHGGRGQLAQHHLSSAGRETVRLVATPTPGWSPAFQVRGDQRQIALADGKFGLLMDLRTGRTHRLVGHTAPIDTMVYSRDGRLVASGAEDRTAIVWDTRTGAVLERFRTDSPATYGLRFSPDGKVLHTAGTDRQLQAWDVTGTARFIPRLVALDGVELGDRWSLASPRGERVAYTWTAGGRAYLRFVSVDGAHVSRLVDTGHGEYGASAWSPDGRRFATTGRDGAVRIWTATGREVRRRVVAPGHVSGLAYDVGGRTLVVSERAGRIRWLDSGTLAEIRPPVDLGASVLLVTASPDGKRVFALTYPPRPPPPNETYPPVNHWALVDARTGAVRQGAVAVTDATAAAFSPDGTHIALGDSEGRVAVLDPATGAWVRSPVRGHDSFVTSVDYGATSRHLVSGAEDGSVSLWDGRSGELVGTVVPSREAPAYARLLDDGRTVQISDVRGRLYRWDIRPARWTRFGCRLAGRDLTRAEWRAEFGDRTREHVCG